MATSAPLHESSWTERDAIGIWAGRQPAVGHARRKAGAVPQGIRHPTGQRLRLRSVCVLPLCGAQVACPKACAQQMGPFKICIVQWEALRLIWLGAQRFLFTANRPTAEVNASEVEMGGGGLRQPGAIGAKRVVKLDATGKGMRAQSPVV